MTHVLTIMRPSIIQTLWNRVKPIVVLLVFGMMHVQGYVGTAFAQNRPHSIGPGGGGAQHAIGINPQDPQNILIGCDMRSNFVSQNGGESFNSFNLWERPVTWYFNPHDENIIYTATSFAIYISKDKGRNWDFLYPSRDDFVGVAQLGTRLTAQPRFTKTPLGVVWGIYVHPNNRNILYAPHVSNGYIYRSTDEGKTWSEWKRMPSHILRLDETGVDTIGGYAHLRIVGNELRMITRYGLYRFHADTGANVSWTYTNADGQTVTANGIAHFPNRNGTMLMKDGQLTVYMSQLVNPAPAANTRSYTRRILKTTDFGATWTCISDNFLNVLESPQGRRPNRGWNENVDFHFVGASGNKVYAGFDRGPWPQNGVAVTEDDGNTWTWVLDFPDRQAGERQFAPFTLLNPLDVRGYPNFSFSKTAPHNMAVNPSDPNHVIVTNLSGAWQTRDGGATWAGLTSRRTDDNDKPVPANKATAYWTTSGIEPAGQWAFAVNPFNKNHYLSGWEDISMFESFDAGKSWRYYDSGHSNTHTIAFDPHNEGVVLAGHLRHIWNNDMWTFNALNPSSTRYSGIIARSTDGGKTWTKTTHRVANNLLSDPVSNGLPSKTGPAGIVFCPIHKNVVYAALRGTGVYKSTDGGINWVPWSIGIPWQTNGTVRGICVHKLVLGKDNRTLFLILSHTDAYATSTRRASAYRLDLERQASMWVEVNRPNGADGSALTTLDRDKKGALYAGALVQRRSENMVPFNGGTRADTYRGGAYVSTDDGLTWRQIYEDRVQTRIFVSSRDNDRLYLTTMTGLVLVSYKGAATTLEDWIPIEGTDKIFYGWMDVWEDPSSASHIFVASACGGTWRMPIPPNETLLRDQAAVKVFQIERGDAGALVRMLESLFATGDNVSIQFAVDRRTNSIVATGLPEDMAIVEGLLRRFTRE